jgi:hypothetical protein
MAKSTHTRFHTVDDLPPALVALFRATEPTEADGCLLWPRTLDSRGYGLVSGHGRSTGAHRIAYILHHGAISPGLVIDHLCRTPACVNPDHLEAVTNRENAMRGLRAGDPERCKNGHPANFRYQERKRGYPSRECRDCGREAVKRYQARKRAGLVP